ncbi:MAG TPA: helix-turn-helix transcriptional regulator [Mycobacterium sp.]|nr:helix-turn-helix transcriptional regulator [Mycobacterium sp.]
MARRTKRAPSAAVEAASDTPPKPVRRRADTRANPFGLTRRERAVLELLAAGNRDVDIATALGIMPKTASNHVGAILAKLGVQNRTKAAAYALTVKPIRSQRIRGTET